MSRLLQSFKAMAVTLVLVGLTVGAGFYMLRASGSAPAVRSGHDHGHGAAGHGHEHETGVKMTEAQIAAAGIELVAAEAGLLRESLRLHGSIQPNQEALVQVTPRFPGIVRSLRARLGDAVAAGHVLATVESNQSLTSYELKAPIAGTIIERNAALGEYVSEQKPLFVVADLSTLWIDLSVHRRDFSRVKLGDRVLVDMEDGTPPLEAKVAYISPIGASDTQTALARVVVAADPRLRPGLFVSARLVLAEKPVDIAIRLAALQTIDGKNVVFVRTAEGFEARELELGARDGEVVEVLFGLLPGDVYAAKNSFVVKSELAKASATHEH